MVSFPASLSHERKGRGNTLANSQNRCHNATIAQNPIEMNSTPLLLSQNSANNNWVYRRYTSDSSPTLSSPSIAVEGPMNHILKTRMKHLSLPAYLLPHICRHQIIWIQELSLIRTDHYPPKASLSIQ